MATLPCSLPTVMLSTSAHPALPSLLKLLILAVVCPADTSGTKSCSGHGRCISMREGAVDNAVDYQEWDSDQIFGCECDGGYRGYNCAIKECPMGDDPSTIGTPEVHVVTTSINFVPTTQRVTVSGIDVQEVRADSTCTRPSHAPPPGFYCQCFSIIHRIVDALPATGSTHHHLRWQCIECVQFERPVFADV